MIAIGAESNNKEGRKRKERNGESLRDPTRSLWRTAHRRRRRRRRPFINKKLIELVRAVGMITSIAIRLERGWVGGRLGGEIPLAV